MSTPLPWPAHWYDGPHRIRCIVENCGFATDTQALPEQWAQLHNHCARRSGPEHALVEIMLRQTNCALCANGRVESGPRDVTFRRLFQHENNDHGSARMFHIPSFVLLARDFSIRFGVGGGHMATEPNCARLAFDRMIEKVSWTIPFAALDLLFQRSGFYAGPNSEGLRRILSFDPWTQFNPNAPDWLPVPAYRFLLFCRPHDNHPADDNWRWVWWNLRKYYANGDI